MPPPRGSQGYDFSPIISHYVLLFTFVLAIIGWLTAFIGQAIATSSYTHRSVGPAWFGIFLQLFVVLGVLHTLATDAIAMHRLQISVFTAVALVFAVIAVDDTIYSPQSSLQATGAGWILLAIIIWALYFTSEEDSLQLHVLNMMGTGGLTPPSRHRRRTTIPNRSSTGGIGGGMGNNGYGTYGAGGLVMPTGTSPKGSAAKDVGGLGPTALSSNTPLMTGAGIGDTSMGSQGPTGPEQGEGEGEGDNEGYAYRAKALYAYTASADDPNEISFTKGEILEIMDNAGKWWQAKKADGQRGNYLQII
ncbi:hypothetical protein BS47DRAFT_1374219 [Hydnum rufescens UP504]|uniref:SH3 domain-containing protein n=1 Tax=Hydnum rufescens UP504 TaxID=1448309 RepID=A0A9P6AI01_9AGAM|nr:hypothetical protein BS47DRAFT_1374219 [Hydnum rufescens UP504]